MGYPVVVVMGVSGCGKSTIATMLAERTGCQFADADDMHPPANVAKMRAAVALTDEDRWPWLDDVAGWIAARHGAGEPGVIACSALKRAYRDRLRRADPDLRVVFLNGSRDILVQRLSNRHGHFFPSSLVDTQLADLEPPSPDEHPLIVQIGQSPDRVVDTILAELGYPEAGG
jgi:gluconokinase